ncbi:hypothetical protein ATX71_09200 [Oenococcus oeni]|nr:hypothetical protein HS16_04475 [Oenococcus oeni]KGH51951.1 hypothetical protein X325_08675 [Oenococcus oeni S11]KGH60580.1 hypothetical protein X467_04740 [Oenococcus oeni S28]KGH63333.1 hypothetical protein X294_06675 [Oenococcus oeni IOEB_CiNe]KGH71513.1 hypothetical protein X282_09635 [Oenococcus oeni IOEB_0608]KGH94044.1 hypothetical protein X464_01940 [Oenococcus oeni S23]
MINAFSAQENLQTTQNEMSSLSLCSNSLLMRRQGGGEAVNAGIGALRAASAWSVLVKQICPAFLKSISFYPDLCYENYRVKRIIKTVYATRKISRLSKLDLKRPRAVPTSICVRHLKRKF